MPSDPLTTVRRGQRYCRPACEMAPPIALESTSRFLKRAASPRPLELRAMDPGEGAGREARREAAELQHLLSTVQSLH